MATLVITVDDIRNRVQNLPIDASTDPSITTVQEMIDEAISMVESIARIQGIPLDATAPSYDILRRMAISRVLADLMLSRDRGLEVAQGFETQYQNALKLLQTMPRAVAPESQVNLNTTVVVGDLQATQSQYPSALSYRNRMR